MGRSQGKNLKKVTVTRAKKIKSLIPMGEKYMKNDLNLLLIGPHGTGKTESVIQIAKEAGLKLKIFNCATLDPYTDLVGIPVPEKNDDGESELKMVRPGTLNDAEVVFFDEINRAPITTQNAVFEIVQFKTINGEELPNLKCCWSAMNPPDGDYKVEDIDPALIDRFDAYYDFKPKVSIQYMETKMKKSTAQALKMWWDDHNQNKRGFENYISPRRLTKLGIIYETIGISAVKKSLPPGGTYDTKKLTMLLDSAEKGTLGKASKATSGIKSQAPISDCVSSRPSLLKNKDKVLKHLKKDKKDIDTQTKIANLLKTNVGAEKLFTDYGEIINALPESQIESIFANFNPAKRSQINNVLYKLKYGTPRTRNKQLNNVDYDKLKSLKSVLRKLRYSFT